MDEIDRVLDRVGRIIPIEDVLKVWGHGSIDRGVEGPQDIHQELFFIPFIVLAVPLPFDRPFHVPEGRFGAVLVNVVNGGLDSGLIEGVVSGVVD